MSVIPNGVGAVAGWAADLAVGEPPTRWHPVAWFGSAMSAVERRTYRDDRIAGVVHLAIGVSAASIVGVVLRRLVGAPTATALACGVAIAGRMLSDEAGAVIELAGTGDLGAARRTVARSRRSGRRWARGERHRARRDRVARREHRRCGDRAVAVGRRRRRADGAGPPCDQHARRHGRTPQRPICELRLGRGARR